MKTPAFLRQARSKAAALGLLCLGLALWELAASAKWINPFYVSRPSAIYDDLLLFVQSGEVVTHLAVTLKEAFLGLALGTIAGIGAGLVLGRIEWLARIFEPVITALYGIPKLALAPLFILWFGLGLESKVFLSGLMVFYLVFFSTFAGIRSVDAGIVAAVKLMGASRWQVLTRVTLPSCVPWIVTGVRGGIGASLLGAIVGEYMGASAGLGWMIQYATTTYQVERVMSCILVLMLIGLALNKALNTCDARLSHWRPDNRP